MKEDASRWFNVVCAIIIFDLMFRIIKHDRDILIISKSTGISFHRGDEGGGLVEQIRAGLGLEEIYTVHRLDRVTSGIVVFAKDKPTARILSSLIRNRIMEKYYIALSDRIPSKKHGVVIGDMKKSRRGSRKLLHTTHNPAITKFKSERLKNGLTFFIIRPLTGKTHQIRVALKSIGAPVLGDPVYYRRSIREKNTDRAYLHAFALRFKLRDKRYEIIDIPEEGKLFNDEVVQEMIRKYSQPWELDWDN
jgi:tRNA pseudouridine32 synthase/23S rRNA pseudouridine746 synthase